MANISFTTDNKIIRDLYDTAEAAQQASKALGCDGGYRTYLINNETKYVPCSSFVLYENALRYRTVQGKIGAFGSDTFGDKLVGLQFANSKDEISGDPFFTLGNFGINKSVPYTQNQARQAQLNVSTTSIQNDAVKSFTVESIAQRNLTYFTGKSYVDELKARVDQNITATVLFDKRKLDNYVLFSSLKTRLKNVLLEIYNQFPAAIKITPVSILNPAIAEYLNYPIEKRSEFKVNLYGLENPFSIEYTTSGTTLQSNDQITAYRNFSKTYKDYVVYYNGNEYPILNVTLPTNYNDDGTGIKLVVDGDPFSTMVNINGELNVGFYIKPKNKIYEEFYANLTDLAGFLLFRDENNIYFSEFLFPKLNDDGEIVNIKETVFFPKYDDFNVDMFGDAFDKYTTKLNDLADSYDAAKTDLIARFLTTDALKEYDTSDRKVNFILELYGKQFDQVKKYIDGITYMRNVSYNKIENIPDLLIKNFATMLGFKTYEIEDEDTLIDSLFQVKQDIITNSITPAELDIELWRRIMINAFYLFKSKGTRKSIEFILKLVGLPDEVFDLNEYVYVADRPINATDALNQVYNSNTRFNPATLLNLMPFDSDGYPTVPKTVVYQEDGGYFYEDKNNVGAFDFGKKYINEYKKYDNVKLFFLERTPDNIKSWVYSEKIQDYVGDELNGYTEYTTDSNKLVINSKELEVYLALNRVFDLTVYRQYMRNIGIVNKDLNINSKLKFDVTNISFNQFVKQALDNFINPLNRKTIKTYPTLTKLYFDYLKTTSTPITSEVALDFLSKFDTSWVKLIEQFVPATSIVNAGKKVQNSIFFDNKFIYKHGKNADVDWLGTDGSEFQQKALKPVYLGTTNVTENKGTIRETIVGNSPTFQISGKQGSNIKGVDPTINEYSGAHYSMFEYCDTTEGRFYVWESGVDYGDDITINYGGNIYYGTTDVSPNSDYNSNHNIPRYGVFVVYNNELYRLNTIAISKYFAYFQQQAPIHTANVNGVSGLGANSLLPPNKGTFNYLDAYSNTLVADDIWEHIPRNVDARTITFNDSASFVYTDSFTSYTIPAIGAKERSFYINSIGRALAYIQMGVDFDCPPPNPHVCYYDFSGRTINNSAFTGTAYRTYTDETGTLLSLKQPKYYGYSKDYSVTQPSNSIYGVTNKWVTPYKKRFPWIDGNIYYPGEIIADINATNKENLNVSSNVYLVTGTSVVTGTATYPTSGTSGLMLLGTAYGSNGSSGASGRDIDPTTITGQTPGGMYERYQDRTKTDPLMHVDTAYINKIKLNPNLDVFSINLTKSLNLLQIFSGYTASETYKVTNNVVNGQLFISDSISASFDGFYHLDKNKIGPFYTLKDDNIFTHTLNDTIQLQPDKDNYISIQSLNDSFVTNGNDLSLIGATPGYYLISKNCFLNFNFKLYFESINNALQTVQIKLVNNLGYVHNMQTFDFTGDDTPDLRQYTFQYSGFFNSGEQIYLVINPINLGCTLSRYEKIDVEYIEPDTYNALEDPRFRLLFNSGFVGRGYYSEGFSVKPVYNLADFTTNSIQLRNNTYRYLDINVPETNYSTDPTFLFNKLYLKFYEKFSQPTFVYDTSSYDKQLGNDKLDFTFTIRSKNVNSSAVPTYGTAGAASGTQVGVSGTKIEYNFSFLDYFLGNTPNITEYNNVTNAISLGKKPKNKTKNYTRVINYIPQFSFYNGSNLGTSLTPTSQSFISYDDGLGDYTQLNYSFDFISELKNKKRYYFNTVGTSSFEYYELQNGVYDSEIYKAILDKVPTFDQKIVNYELNDVVKFPIDGYKVVVNTPTGKTIQTKTVYKLYVCVNDIHQDHCYKVYNTGSSTYEQGEIHPVYRPRGSRSCFTPIEKYNPANFTPWGYEELNYGETQNANINDYIYKNIIAYDPTSSLDFKFGDLVMGNYEGTNYFFRYIYQKPVTYLSNQTYYAGDFVVRYDAGSVNQWRYYVARKTSTNNALPTLPNLWNAYWTLIGGDVFDHRSLIATSAIGATSGITSIGSTWINWDGLTGFSSTAARIPKTLPVNTDGTPYITTGNTNPYTYKGITYNFDYNNLLVQDNMFIDQSYLSFDGYETISINRLLRSIPSGTGVHDIRNYSGLAIPTTDNDNYTDGNYYSRLNKTNIYLKPGYTLDGASYYGYPFLNDITQSSPLFERLCPETRKNNPNNWVIGATTGPTYNKTLLYLGNKYAVNRGVLYKYIDDTALSSYSPTPQEPYANTNSWEERDFCLVSNFVYYKDRTNVTVFESNIESLTSTVKNGLYFYTPNLSLKNSFTNRTFSGSTINNKLMTALDKFYDITDTNRVTPGSHGQIDFRASGNDIIMDFYPEKDQVGYPLTGEFMGRLKLTNPCGQTATTFFGILFDTDVNLLDRQKNINSSATIVPQAAEILPYLTRVIVAQNGNSNATISISYLDSNGNTITDTNVVNKHATFDKKYDIIPSTTVTINITYSTGRYQTTFKSASIDGNPIFVNNAVTNTATLNTELIKDQSSEIRTIKLKNIQSNSTVYIELAGITQILSDNTISSAKFDVKLININTSKL